EQTKKKGGFRRALGWTLVGTAVAGAGVLIWRRTKPVDDPWAEEYWDDAPAAVSPTVAEKLHTAADAVKDTTESTKEKVEEVRDTAKDAAKDAKRSEEHTSELQSRFDLVCRLLLEK